MDNISVEGWRCPNCGKNHFTDTCGSTTLMYFQPVYKDGVNINPDRNSTSFSRICLECGKKYVICGNAHDGYNVREE